MSCPASSQPRPVAPLAPRIVRLDSGAVAKRPLVGIDTAAWRAIRVNTALDQRQLADRAAQIKQLNDLRRLDSTSTMRLADEAASTRRDNEQLHEALRKQEAISSKVLALPLRPPLLADTHTYIGGGAAVFLVALVKLFILH